MTKKYDVHTRISRRIDNGLLTSISLEPGEVIAVDFNGNVWTGMVVDMRMADFGRGVSHRVEAVLAPIEEANESLSFTPKKEVKPPKAPSGPNRKDESPW